MLRFDIYSFEKLSKACPHSR